MSHDIGMGPNLRVRPHATPSPPAARSAPPTGRALLSVLGKRRTDLTESDAATTRRVVERVQVIAFRTSDR